MWERLSGVDTGLDPSFVCLSNRGLTWQEQVDPQLDLPFPLSSCSGRTRKLYRIHMACPYLQILIRISYTYDPRLHAHVGFGHLFTFVSLFSDHYLSSFSACFSVFSLLSFVCQNTQTRRRHDTRTRRRNDTRTRRRHETWTRHVKNTNAHTR